jgi:hypothetical protein
MRISAAFADALQIGEQPAAVAIAIICDINAARRTLIASRASDHPAALAVAIERLAGERAQESRCAAARIPPE